jgi:hypothetical protein
VFAERADGARHFAPAPAPNAGEVARLLAAVRRRIIRLVARHGIDLEHPSEESDTHDERLLDCPVYAEIQGAAVLGRVATGRRAGGRVARVGGEPARLPRPKAMRCTDGGSIPPASILLSLSLCRCLSLSERAGRRFFLRTSAFVPPTAEASEGRG